MSTNNTNDNQWIGINSLETTRRKTILWASVGFVVYLMAVIIGTELQRMITDKLTMNWGQQIFGALLVLVLSLFHKNPKELLGIAKPQRATWLKWTLLFSAATILFGVVVSIVTNEPDKLEHMEFYLYQSLMPSLGEELGLRGFFLGFLLYYAKKNNFSTRKVWFLLVLQAIPFGLLHLLEVQSITQALLIFSFTTFAGIGLGWLRLKTASIYPSIIAHSIVNVFGNIVGYYCFEFVN